MDHTSWHGIFYASAAVAFVALAATWILLPPGKTTPNRGRIDVPGALFFVPAVFAILLALSRWSQWGGITSPLLWALLLGGSLTIAFWARHELRHEHPLINVRLLGNRQIMLTILCLGLMCGGAMCYGIIFPMYLTQPAWNIPAGGLSSTAAASILFPSVLLGGLGALFMAPLVHRIGSRNTLITASLLLVSAWTALAFYHDTAWLIGLLLVPQSMGVAMTLAVVPVLLNEVVPLDHTSEVNGLASLFRQIGVSTGSILVGLVLKADGGHGAATTGSNPPPQAFTDAIWLVALICTLCLGCALALPRTASRIHLATAIP